MKTLILYALYEINDNVKYFIKNGLFKSENEDFLFIVNNPKINLDVPSYVKIMKRENKGFDFGGWSFGLLKNNNYKKYDYFIFLNQSVIGPFLPNYFKDKWTKIFINGLSDNIKLFGTTINSSNWFEKDKKNRNDPKTQSHVQSMTFCCSKETVLFLIKNNIFTLKQFCKTKEETIIKKEIRMSRLIINNNWNIGCLMKLYEGIDFTFKKNSNRNKIFLGDVCFKNGYLDSSLHPYEFIFIKNNRNVPINKFYFNS